MNLYIYDIADNLPIRLESTHLRNYLNVKICSKHKLKIYLVNKTKRNVTK